jgi:hypothetical protein
MNDAIRKRHGKDFFRVVRIAVYEGFLRRREFYAAQAQRSADFPVCRVAGFLTRERLKPRQTQPRRHPADLEIGDTAGWETCATLVAFLPRRIFRS